MDDSGKDDRPPLLPSWGTWYALVLGTLLLIVALLTLLARVYA